jgi:murein DD-endopeptidase MepM/ murein hydrolase activator NlpD
VAERWLRPVPGAVTRSFSYSPRLPFRAGAHRGADFAAARGTAVRAVCAGRVLHAGPVARAAAVVTVGCAARRVTYLPLAALRVRVGAWVHEGAAIGALAGGHGGALHLGVRRAGDRFAYEDPLGLVPDRPPGVSPPQAVPRLRRPPAGGVRARPASAPRARDAAPRLEPRADSNPTARAPWPAWAGLIAVALGIAGSGSVALHRHERRSGRRAHPVRSPA